MKQFKFFKTIAIMMGMLMSISLVSCGDDDDEPDNDKTTKTEYTQVYYKLNIGSAWYDLFDVELTFTGIDGQVYSGTAYRNSEYNERIASSLAPSSLSIKVVAKPRSEAPTITDDVVYDLGKHCAMSVYKYEDGATNILPIYTYSPSIDKTIKGGDTLREYVKKEHVIFSCTYPEEEGGTTEEE
jgi:hypothetical protein